MMTLEELKQEMDAAGYVYDDTMATVLYVALLLGRPLLIEAMPVWARRKLPR